MNEFLERFRNDFFWILGRFWLQKPLQHEGPRVIFSISSRICEKCDFEQPSNGFAIFLDFGRVDLRLQNVYFSIVFSNAILRPTFWNLDRILVQIVPPNGPKFTEKIYENRSWFFNEILMEFGRSSWRLEGLWRRGASARPRGPAGWGSLKTILDTRGSAPAGKLEARPSKPVGSGWG